MGPTRTETLGLLQNLDIRSIDLARNVGSGLQLRRGTDMWPGQGCELRVQAQGWVSGLGKAGDRTSGILEGTLFTEGSAQCRAGWALVAADTSATGSEEHCITDARSSRRRRSWEDCANTDVQSFVTDGSSSGSGALRRAGWAPVRRPHKRSSSPPLVGPCQSICSLARHRAMARTTRRPWQQRWRDQGHPPPLPPRLPRTHKPNPTRHDPTWPKPKPEPEPEPKPHHHTTTPPHHHTTTPPPHHPTTPPPPHHHTTTHRTHRTPHTPHCTLHTVLTHTPPPLPPSFCPTHTRPHFPSPSLSFCVHMRH